MATALTSPGASGASGAGEGGTGGAGGGEGTQGGSFAGDPAFDAGVGGAGGDGDGAGGADPAAPAASPELFRFAQRQWPNQERAEREFLTTIGRLQSEQRRVRELEQLVEDFRASRGQGGAPDGADPGETGAGGEGEGEQPLVDIDSLDWQLIASAMADQSKGPAVGLYLAMKGLADALGKGFDGRMKTSLAPLEALRGHAMQSAQSARLWQAAADATDQGGNLHFPELSDPQAGPLVQDIWRQITEGLPPEVANSPRMVRSAILEYRALMAGQPPVGDPGGGNGAGGAGDGGVNPNAVAASLVGAMRAGAQGAGVLPTPAGGRQPVPARRAKPQTEEDRIRQSLLSEGQERGTLGFRR